MRLTRLELGRYGHLSDVRLDFDPAMPLHIVLGANEAGKSTALSAIADALFGFPHRTSFAFAHRPQDLRLGVGLLAADGRSAFFLRRKGLKETLRHADETVVPETAIAAFLTGASRERFTEIFGMDAAELRRGGAAILDGKTEIGESIVQAYTGLPHARGALGRLNDAALQLYGDRRGGRAFHVAAEAFRAARQDVETRSVRPADYDLAARERADILAARSSNAQETVRLEAERARLDRIRRTTPARLALLAHRKARAALGDVPALPADANSVRAASLLAHTALSLEHARLRETQEADEAALSAIVVDDAVLGEADRIDALTADRNRIERAAQDRAIRVVEEAQARQLVEQQGRNLGLAVAADDLAARLPNGFLRAQAERAIREHAGLAVRREEAATEAGRAEAAVLAARRLLDSLAEPAPMQKLRTAVAFARGEGRIDHECAQAEGDLAASQAALAHALAELGFWHGDADSLAQAQVPLTAACEQGGAALLAAEAAMGEQQRALDGIDRALDAVDADLAGVLAAGAPPTVEAVQHARLRRDQAWRLIRAASHGGAPAEPAPGLDDLPADLVGAFADLVAEADSLADRRGAEAERVAAYEQLRANQARLQMHRAAGVRACEKAQTMLQAAQAAWQNLWQPAGLSPGDPAQMRVFLARRQHITGLREEAAARARHSAQCQERRQAVCHALAPLLPEHASETRCSLLLQAATLRLEALEADHHRVTEARRSLTERENALAEHARKRQSLDAASAAWQAAWAPVAAALGLPDGADAQAGAEALGIWAEIDRHARDMRSARQRIADMTADIEVFHARVGDACAACATDLAGEAAGVAARALAGRLAQNRVAEADRSRLRQVTTDRAAHLRAVAGDMARAQDTLAALRALAGVDDDAALQEAIARTHIAADLARNMEERARELEGRDDGLSLEALSREAESEEGETLSARIAAIDSRRRAIADENEGFASRLRDLETRIAAMERGHDAAEAAQRMRDAAAETEEIAARYVRLRLSHSLLRAGIERLRREQQAPLLLGAGRLFATLTEGRYAALGVEESEEGRVVVVALRPDGASCPADRLSEGTRDQLYLALRLAAIASHAAQTEPLPFIADDLLASFDDRRAQAALQALAAFGAVTQTILFTHHAHIAAMADASTTQLHRLAAL